MQRVTLHLHKPAEPAAGLAKFDETVDIYFDYGFKSHQLQEEAEELGRLFCDFYDIPHNGVVVHVNEDWSANEEIDDLRNCYNSLLDRCVSHAKRISALTRRLAELSPESRDE